MAGFNGKKEDCPGEKTPTKGEFSHG